MLVEPSNVAVAPLAHTFHPHLVLGFHHAPDQTRHETEGCHTHLSLALPDSLFVDPDELVGSWASQSSGMISYDILPSVIDIERPYRTQQHDHTPIRLDVILPDNTVSLDIPLHGRYLPPNEQGYERVTVIGDQVGDEGEKGTLRAARICSVPAGTQLSFTDLPAVSLPSPVTLLLPTGKHSHQSVTELGTAVVIWLGWLYLVWKMWRLVQRVDMQTLQQAGKKIN